MDDNPIDDYTFLTLEDAARLLFPAGPVTADTLKRRARQGKLVVYRPGKRYLTTPRNVKAMLNSVKSGMPARSPVSHNTDHGLANAALDAALAKVRKGLLT